MIGIRQKIMFGFGGLLVVVAAIGGLTMVQEVLPMNQNNMNEANNAARRLAVAAHQRMLTAIIAATQRVLSNTLTLAHQLGATVFTYKGDDIVKTILQFAREYRVGHIVLGTPGRKMPFWRRLLGEVSLVERLITEGRDITVVVVDTRALPDTSPPGAAPLPPAG